MPFFTDRSLHSQLPTGVPLLNSKEQPTNLPAPPNPGDASTKELHWAEDWEDSQGVGFQCKPLSQMIYCELGWGVGEQGGVKKILDGCQRRQILIQVFMLALKTNLSISLVISFLWIKSVFSLSCSAVQFKTPGNWAACSSQKSSKGRQHHECASRKLQGSGEGVCALAQPLRAVFFNLMTPMGLQSLIWRVVVAFQSLCNLDPIW